MLDALDDLKGVIGVIVVPDFLDSADQWANRWSPIVHGQSQSPPVSLIDDPVVEAALLHLTQMVNLSTGLVHPRDKDMAIEVLRILRNKRELHAKVRKWRSELGKCRAGSGYEWICRQDRGFICPPVPPLSATPASRGNSCPVSSLKCDTRPSLGPGPGIALRTGNGVIIPP